MIYAWSREVVHTFCEGFGCCGVDLCISLRRGPVPLQALLCPQPLPCSVPSPWKPSGFSSCRTETSFAPRIPSQTPGHPQPPCHAAVSESSGFPSFAAFLDAFQRCQPVWCLKQPAPSIQPILPRPSQGFALRSLRFYSVSAISVLSSLSVHKF